MLQGIPTPFEEMSQRWQAVSNTMSDKMCRRFELQTSHFRDERVTSSAKYGMERKFCGGILKMPEWNGIKDFKNGMEYNLP